MEKYVEDTEKHIKSVQKMMGIVIDDLKKRSKEHDMSKMEEPELSLGAKMSKELSGVEYGTSNYFSILKKYEDNVNTHYSKNRHHPEYFEGRVKDMNLADITEMVCDWMARITENNPDYDREKVIEQVKLNLERYEIDGLLAKVICNSI